MKLITAPIEKKLCVFLVGMQLRGISSFWKVPLVTRQMLKMQKKLLADQESGFLSGENFTKWSPFTTLFLSYWQSADHIHRFTKNSHMPHLSVAKEYWKKLSQDKNLGIWHETYEIQPGSAENLYMNMNPFGACAFLKTQEVERNSNEFLARLRRTSEKEGAR